MNRDHELAAVAKATEKPITADGRKARKHYSDGTEKRPPKHSGWFESRNKAIAVAEFVKASSFSVWLRRGVTVISASIRAHAPDGSKEVIPQWHLSFRADGRRCNDEEVRLGLASFGIAGAEEDNHHPGGGARHFFMPVDPKRRVDCECKTDERTIVESDGYRSTTSIDGPCSGCELVAAKAEIGVRSTCPLHP